MYRFMTMTCTLFLMISLTSLVAEENKEVKNSSSIKKADITKGNDGKYYANGRQLRFYPTTSGRGVSPAKIVKIELYYSDNKGKKWQVYSERSGSVKNANSIFTFNAPHDGEYLFASVSTDELGQQSILPKGLKAASLIVNIDTAKPVLTEMRDKLKLDCHPSDIRKIRWKNKDTNPYYVRLEEYKPMSKSWGVLANVKTQDFYVLQVPNIPYEYYKVRMTAVDMAGNETMGKPIIFKLGPLKTFAMSSISVPASLRKKHITFNMGFQNLDVDSFSHYEVYYTTDRGQSWALAGTTKKDTFSWKIPRDGLYGFYSAVKNKDGNGEAVPTHKNTSKLLLQPKVNCLVDSKKPVLVMDSPRGGERYTSKRPLVVSWHGIEANCSKKPVKIEMSRDNGVNYKFEAMGTLSGSYHIPIDGFAGHNFFIRLSIEDGAGNYVEVLSKRFAIGMLTAVEQATVQKLYNEANALRVFGRYKESIMKYEDVLTYNIQHVKSINDMGVVYMKMKQYDKAIKLFQRASVIGDKNVNYHYNLAYAFYVNDMPLLAQSAFERCLDLNKNHVRSHWYLSEILFINKDVKNSRKHLEQILKIDDASNQLRPIAQKRLALYPK